MKTQINKAVEIVGSQAKLADLIGMSAGMMSQVCTGHRPLPDIYCRRVEEATNGKVSRVDLTPNWHFFWPELKDK